MQPYTKYTVRDKARWQQMRDFRQGEDVIHARGELYLPRLPGQTDLQYEAYVQRAELYNATDRTIVGMVGMATRKGLIITDEEPAFKDLSKDISNRGQSLDQYARTLVDQMATVSRAGTLVDYPQKTDGTALSQGMAKELGLQPRFAFYTAESILDWEYTRVSSGYQLTKVVLVEAQVKEFDLETQYRWLEINDEGVYTQQITDSSGNQIGDEIRPTWQDGKPFMFIPFIFHTLAESGDIILPPVNFNLATLNIKHYQQKADQAHGLQYVALPTPWVAGVQDDERPKTIGPQEIWAFSSAQVKVGLLEFTGAGMAAIAEEVKAKEVRMAAMGARVIAGDPFSGDSGTATEANYSHQAETSVTADIIRTINADLQRAVDILLEWNGTPMEKLKVSIPLDFMPIGMTAQKLIALVTAWQKGAMSKDTMWWNFKSGEVMPMARSADDEQSLIDQDPPSPDAGGTQ